MRGHYLMDGRDLVARHTVRPVIVTGHARNLYRDNAASDGAIPKLAQRSIVSKHTTV